MQTLSVPMDKHMQIQRVDNFNWESWLQIWNKVSCANLINAKVIYKKRLDQQSFFFFFLLMSLFPLFHACSSFFPQKTSLCFDGLQNFSCFMFYLCLTSYSLSLLFSCEIEIKYSITVFGFAGTGHIFKRVGNISVRHTLQDMLLNAMGLLKCCSELCNPTNNN